LRIFANLCVSLRIVAFGPGRLGKIGKTENANAANHNEFARMKKKKQQTLCGKGLTDFLPVPNGTQWFPMVSNGIEWCSTVANGSQWLRMVANGTAWDRATGNGQQATDRDQGPGTRE
ncbi:MAG TPA: hypothetical protein VM098_07800, partial [Phycisphaerae bacterium]|nr:hypothetical protein [Phycisphaerae bacterium]